MKVYISATKICTVPPVTWNEPTLAQIQIHQPSRKITDMGHKTEEDLMKLQNRVRNENDKDIQKEVDALYIFGTNKKVNHHNIKRLKDIQSNEKVIPGTCLKEILTTE